MIGTNAGPNQLAGEQCNELFFTTSWQNDQTPEAMGKYMTDQGLNDVYLMAPNYAAGKDMLTGFKRTFKGTHRRRGVHARSTSPTTRPRSRSCARRTRRR